MSAKGFIRNFKPLEILTEEQVEAAHRDAIDILQETGIRFESRRSLKIMEKGGCRVDYDQMRVRIPPGLVTECIKTCPSTFHMKALDPDNDIIIGGNTTYTGIFPGNHTVELDTWEVRPPTIEENNDACKVADCLENVHSATSYAPYCEIKDVPPIMMLPVSTWSRMKYFSKISRVGTIENSHVWEIKMAQAIGVDVYGAMEATPPLTYTKSAAECGIDCAKAGFPVEGGCGGVMGGTHPVTLAGALITGMAEVIACIVLVQLVRRGNPVFANSFNLAQNMKSGAPIFGSPNNSLFNVMWNQVWRAKNIPTQNAGESPSNSKKIDYQCGYEKSMGALLSGLSGAHLIISPGGLTCELSYHPVLSIIENDMLGWMGHFLRGVLFNEDTLALDLIEKVGPVPGFYLDKEHTRKWWKKEQFIPEVADLSTYPEWIQNGKKSTLENAKEKMQEILNSYKCKLSEEKQQELDKILDETKEYYKNKNLV